jgi:hypothetical protein
MAGAQIITRDSGGNIIGDSDLMAFNIKDLYSFASLAIVFPCKAGV